MKTKHKNASIYVTKNINTGKRLACVFHDTHKGWDGPNPVYDVTDSSLARIEQISDLKTIYQVDDVIRTIYR